MPSLWPTMARTHYPDLRQDEFREHSELKPGDDLLQVADAQGNWIFRSGSIQFVQRHVALFQECGHLLLVFDDQDAHTAAIKSILRKPEDLLKFPVITSRAPKGVWLHQSM